MEVWLLGSFNLARSRQQGGQFGLNTVHMARMIWYVYGAHGMERYGYDLMIMIMIMMHIG